jgi:diguanylate cyclase (GGDEF)-like protein
MRQFLPSDRSRSVEILIVSAIAVVLVVQICWVASYFAGARISRFLTSMNPTVGLCFDGAAATLWLARNEQPRGKARRVGLSLSWLILAIGLSKLADLLFGTRLCPDGLLIPESLRPAARYPGQMSPSVAVCFCVLGLALLSLQRSHRPRILPPQLMMTAILCVALTVLIGYSYNTGGFYKYLPMSGLTAFDFILLGAVIILVRPDEGFMARLPGGSPGARSFARLLPACVLIPWALSGVTVVAAERGWYDKAGTGSAIAAVLTILAMSAIVFFNSARLNRTDAERRAAEISLQITVDELDRRNRELEQEIAERKLAEQRAAHLATHDSLTGLPNRVLFADRLQNAIGRAVRQGGNFALFYMDLDRFKPVNDLHGHSAGDMLLQDLSGRMALALREVDMVARLGGDEFGAIMEGPIDEQSARAMAERLSSVIGVPYHLSLAGLPEPLDVAIGISVGIALFPGDATDFDGLIRAADGAMYRAKAAGRVSGRTLNVEMANHPSDRAKARGGKAEL